MYTCIKFQDAYSLIIYYCCGFYNRPLGSVVEHAKHNINYNEPRANDTKH